MNSAYPNAVSQRAHGANHGHSQTPRPGSSPGAGAGESGARTPTGSVTIVVAGEELSRPLAEAPASFHVMAKPSGALCNLNCSYCFYLANEALYPGSRFRMTAELQELYIRQLLEATRTDEVVIAWQGGEPTIMGLDFFRRAIELERRYARPGQQVQNTLQTNGTRLDEEWATFLKENDFLVGISIDGPPEIHDRYRVDKGGKPTFARVLRGLEHLQRQEVEWNALTCVHAGNGDQATRVYRFLRDELAARFIQFIPIVERTAADSREATAQVTDRSVGAHQYGRFLIDVFEEWVRRDVGTVFVQAFDTALAHWCGLPNGVCVHDETCGLQVALEHTGDLYSCDHFVEPGHLLGNIEQEHMLDLVGSAQQRSFGRDKQDLLTQRCRDCEVRFACNGGCPKDRFIDSPEGEPGHNYLCAGYEAFFHHVGQPMRVMADHLEAGQPPASVMNRYAREDARRGRNDPCTCGSGRKWKHCHGAG